MENEKVYQMNFSKVYDLLVSKAVRKGRTRQEVDRKLIKGVVCGVRVEDVEEPLMREIRYSDKLVDDLAKGKPMEKILFCNKAAQK